jgi:hypothetical protein
MPTTDTAAYTGHYILPECQSKTNKDPQAGPDTGLRVQIPGFRLINVWRTYVRAAPGYKRLCSAIPNGTQRWKLLAG